jgi:hypothetical protein
MKSMARKLKGSLISILSLIFISCAGKVIYTVNNVNYKSPDPAIAAHKSELDAIVSKVTPTSHPVGGSAIVILAGGLGPGLAITHFIKQEV